MNKKFSGAILVAGLMMMISSCDNDVRRTPRRVYMPDMAYSRAYETYAELDSAKFTGEQDELGGDKIFYNSLPVAGTVARGEMAEFPEELDKPGETVNYDAAKNIINPLPALGEKETAEAERLYLVNCGICHGQKLDGNGPLYKGGDGPFSAAPKNFMADDMKIMAPGTMFYSVTYGKGQMGSYASQLSSKQRWMVISYIKSKQGPDAPAAADSATVAKN